MPNHSIQKQKKKHKGVRYIIVIVLILFLVPFGTILYGIQASKELTVSHYRIRAHIPASLRIVHLSDLHNARYGQDNKELIRLIKDQQPELIVMTGDMLNKDDPDSSIITSLIKELSEITYVIVGYGNHEKEWERTFGQSLYDVFTEAGAIVIDDSFIDWEVKGIPLRIGACMTTYREWQISETDPAVIEKEDRFADAFEDTDRYKILLDHIPDSFVNWGGIHLYDVNLVFAGHLHGGIVRLPLIDRALYLPFVGFLPRHTKGVSYGTRAIAVQSAGLGNEYFIPRIYNPPEIVVVDLVGDGENHR